MSQDHTVAKIGVFVSALALIGAFLVPEVRQFFGLERPLEIPAAPVGNPRNRVLSSKYSKSGNTILDFCGDVTATEVWLRQDGGRFEQKLCSSAMPIYDDALFSEDDSVIVFSWGSGSAGRYPALFVRQRDGRYANVRIQAHEMAERHLRDVLRLSKKATFTHIYTDVIRIETNPYRLRLAFRGDYCEFDYGPQKNFPQTFANYDLTTGNLRATQ